MKKHTMAYEKHADLQKIQTQQTACGIQIRPLCSGAHNQECFRFEVMKESKNDDLETASNSFDYSTVTCNICNIPVPTKYFKEHKKSEKHIICMKLANTALQRVKAKFKANMLKDTQSILTEPVTGEFCAPCAMIITNEHHETSGIHKSAVLYDKLLEDLIMIYLNRDNINNINFEYLTNLKTKDIENEGEKNSIDYVNMNIENGNAIKYPTQYENNDTKIINDEKRVTAHESKDLENNIEIECPTVCQKKVLDSVDDIHYRTELENKDTDISNQEKRKTACENDDLENKVEKKSADSQNKDSDNVDEIKYSTEFDNKDIANSNEAKHPTHCENKDLESLDEIKHSLNCNIEGFDETKKVLKRNFKNKKEINRKQDIEDVTEQIIYKHTTVITDLSSMESYLKILMKIFPQTSLIYVYMNKMFVGINIGDFKLKVHVDNFLGIKKEINMCLLCSSKFTDREEHIYNVKHMRKVMAPIEDQHCIRKINETNFYCVICARVIVSKQINEYIDKTENLAEKVGHIASECHKSNFDKALLYDASRKRQDDLPTRTSKTFYDEHICNVCGLFLSNSVAKDRNAGSINNSKYREYFCNNCQTFMPLKIQLEHIEDDIFKSNAENSKKYNYMLHPKHAIKTYCGACDIYINTHYLENHTSSKNHKKVVASNASLFKLAQTKAELKNKTVTTAQSGRNTASIANEVLEDLLWAQMKVSENPKEVICKVCNVAVAKALENVQNHIKGKNHQKNFNIILFFSDIEKRDGLDQICVKTNRFIKVEHVKCENCNISIPNTRQDVEEHVIGINHQNEISKRLYNMEEYKPYTVDEEVMSSQLSRNVPVKVPSSTRYHKATTINKSQSIPIENLIKANNNAKVKKLRPLNFKEAMRPVVQADQVNKNNLEKIILKPTWVMQNFNINLPKNSNTNVDIKQLPLNFKDNIGLINVQTDTSSVNKNNSEKIPWEPTYLTSADIDRGINPFKNSKTSINTTLRSLDFNKDLSPVDVQDLTCQVNRDNLETISSKPTHTTTQSKNKTSVNRILRPLNFEEDTIPVSLQGHTSQVNENNPERITSKQTHRSIATIDSGINPSKNYKKIVRSGRHQLKMITKEKYHCIVCNIDLPQIHLSDHLLELEHENNYKSLLSSNKIIEQRGGKLFCKLCHFEMNKQQCVLTHIEGIIHQTNIKAPPSNVQAIREF